MRAMLIVALLATTPGCSFIFVKTAPPSDGRITARPGRCTSSKAMPVLDTVFAGLQGVRTAYAAAAPDSVYEDPDVPLSREADIGIGAGPHGTIRGIRRLRLRVHRPLRSPEVTS